MKTKEINAENAEDRREKMVLLNPLRALRDFVVILPLLFVGIRVVRGRLASAG